MIIPKLVNRAKTNELDGIAWSCRPAIPSNQPNAGLKAHTLDQELTLTTLRGALSIGIPEIHHSDQGVQYAADAYTELLKVHGIQISMAAVGKAEENGYAERVIRTIKEEEVYLSEYLGFADASQQIGHFIEDVYMTKRIHSSLGYLTPAEFELACRRAQTETPWFPPKNPEKSIQLHGSTTGPPQQLRHDPLGISKPLHDHLSGIH